MWYMIYQDVVRMPLVSPQESPPRQAGRLPTATNDSHDENVAYKRIILVQVVAYTCQKMPH